LLKQLSQNTGCRTFLQASCGLNSL